MTQVTTADFHTHTTLSDGSLTAWELLLQAKRLQKTHIAVTDHDALQPASTFAEGDYLGVKVIPAIEFSARDTKRNRRLHILCYAYKKPEILLPLCLATCRSRSVVSLKMLTRLKEHFPLSDEFVLKYSTGSAAVYKWNIVSALYELGMLGETKGKQYTDVFGYDGICGDLIKEEMAGYPSAETVIDVIHEAGGLAVLAHPFQYNSTEFLEETAAAGDLDGVEVDHPSATDEQKTELIDTAKRHGLFKTGGSDFHGIYNHYPTGLLGKRHPYQDGFDRIVSN
ncbi:MAG: PHP domain-containing protein [Oscillospiraceae bacterium]|jgi:predicted metal-dependent phosphoesterase TrpH|nr:PHP domain-containing protein [Oscillospiraceae bacterium]